VVPRELLEGLSKVNPFITLQILGFRNMEFGENKDIWLCHVRGDAKET
jgi:hypothetical protein